MLLSQLIAPRCCSSVHVIQYAVTLIRTLREKGTDTPFLYNTFSGMNTYLDRLLTEFELAEWYIGPSAYRCHTRHLQAVIFATLQHYLKTFATLLRSTVRDMTMRGLHIQA